MPVSFDKYFQMRERAKKRAQEMANELKERLKDNPDIVKNYCTDKLEAQIREVYYESEKLAEQYRKNDSGH
jgi:hypothetical protein